MGVIARKEVSVAHFGSLLRKNGIVTIITGRTNETPGGAQRQPQVQRHFGPGAIRLARIFHEQIEKGCRFPA
jgi:hypothetical protein